MSRHAIALPTDILRSVRIRLSFIISDLIVTDWSA